MHACEKAAEQYKMNKNKEERRMIFVKKSKMYPWYFAAGALLIYTALSVVPGLIGIGYSFTDWSAYSNDLHFVG